MSAVIRPCTLPGCREVFPHDTTRRHPDLCERHEAIATGELIPA